MVGKSAKRLLNGVYEPTSFSHSVDLDIDHPTNVKTWMIFAKGKSWVHAGMT